MSELVMSDASAVVSTPPSLVAPEAEGSRFLGLYTTWSMPSFATFTVTSLWVYLPAWGRLLGPQPHMSCV